MHFRHQCSVFKTYFLSFQIHSNKHNARICLPADQNILEENIEVLVDRLDNTLELLAPGRFRSQSTLKLISNRRNARRRMEKKSIAGGWHGIIVRVTVRL